MCVGGWSVSTRWRCNTRVRLSVGLLGGCGTAAGFRFHDPSKAKVVKRYRGMKLIKPQLHVFLCVRVRIGCSFGPKENKFQLFAVFIWVIMDNPSYWICKYCISAAGHDMSEFHW